MNLTYVHNHKLISSISFYLSQVITEHIASYLHLYFADNLAEHKVPKAIFTDDRLILPCLFLKIKTVHVLNTIHGLKV